MPTKPNDTATSTLRQRRKAERPQELIDAALAAFVEKGLSATRMEDVAKLAGVSKGTLYLYYPSKEELFKAVVRGTLLPTLAEAKVMIDHWQGNSSDLIRLLLRIWWQHIGSSPGSDVYKLIVTDVGNVPDLAQFYLDEIMRPSYEMLGATFQRGIDRGEFRRIDVNMLVQSLLAPAQFVALYSNCTRHIVDNPYPMEAELFMKTNLELFLSGLKVQHS